MSGEQQLLGPDLSQGISLNDLADGGQLLGHLSGEAVLLVRQGEEIFAIGATCTHYGGPLAEGLIVGDRVRCPWHHACFSLRTGEAVKAPALNPVACYRVERHEDQITVGKKIEPPKREAQGPDSVLIVGAGAAGNAAAEELRRQGYGGRIVLIGPEGEVPYDRPNLSKDYLAGNAPEEWIPLHPEDFYAERKIEMVKAGVKSLDPKAKTVTLDDERTLTYGALILATGAEPIRLPIPGADLPHVHVLRSLADSRALIEKAKTAKRAVVIGASFIGLETAAALRARNLEVDNGVLVDEHLETSAPSIFAVGDIARWPDPWSGERIRVEHWVVAERQGQTAARNILGQSEPFADAPFFWSQHYDVSINYVGHATKWDAIEVHGSLQDRSAVVAYRMGHRIAAVATMWRDQESLEAELAMERGDAAALEAAVAG